MPLEYGQAKGARLLASIASVLTVPTEPEFRGDRLGFPIRPRQGGQTLKRSMGRKNRVTSLFTLVESMQRRLEAEGLDSEVVDLAVTRGLQTLLRPARRGAEQLTKSLFLSTFAVPAQT